MSSYWPNFSDFSDKDHALDELVSCISPSLCLTGKPIMVKDGRSNCDSICNERICHCIAELFGHTCEAKCPVGMKLRKVGRRLFEGSRRTFFDWIQPNRQKKRVI